MSTVGQHVHEDDDGNGFMRGAMETARMNGACILEWFTCPRCNKQQCASHSFRRTVNCGQCGQEMKSRVPALPTEGMVTAEMLTAAIRTVKSLYPECDDKTAEWLEKLEGAVRCTSIAYGCHLVRDALDKVEELARQMSGGHGPSPRRATQ